MTVVPRMALRLHSGMSPARCAALARHAESCGFAAVWFAENPYERGVLPAAAATALATARVDIGIGVFNPYNRHPTLMAMEMGALDELSEGRAVLGIGAGVPKWVERIVPHERPLSALRDAAVIARALLAGEEVTHEGRVFSAHGVRLGSAPARRVPVYLAAMAENSLRLCGEIGDGVIIGNMCPPPYTRKAIALMGEGAARAQRPIPAAAVKYVPCAVGSDAAAARQVAKQAVGVTLAAYWDVYEAQAAVRRTISEGNGIAPERFAECLRQLAAGAPAAEALDDGFATAYAVSGTPDQCAAQCLALAEDGVTELALSFLGDDAEGQMTRLADALEIS